MNGTAIERKRFRPLRYLLPLAMLLLAVALWRFSLDGAAQLARLGQRKTYACAERKAGDYEAMLAIEEGSALSRAFALWGQSDGEYASDPVSQRKAQASVLRVVGDVRLVLPLSGALEDGDAGGCLIDEQTALDLFNTTKAQGNALCIGEEEYTVRGVFPGPKGTVILRPGEEDALGWVSVEDASLDEGFAQRQGLGERQAQPYGEIADIMARLPTLALLLIAAAAAFRLARRYRLYSLRSALLNVAFFALLTAFLLALIQTIPPSLTPSRWSDFSYYAGAAKRLSEGTLALFAMKKTQGDLYLASLCAVSFSGLLSAALLLVAAGRVRLIRAEEARGFASW